jgi:hypothetical protein
MIEYASRHVIEGFAFPGIEAIYLFKADHHSFLNGIIFID